MTRKPKISIIDYGVGNLQSALKAFRRFSENVVITDDPKIISDSDALVLPGVGAFRSGMEGLEVRGLTDTVKEFAQSGKPVLGICLGAQLLFSKGLEFGEHQGLDIVSGKVAPFPELQNKEKIPQVGWNGIYPGPEQSWKNTPLQDIPERTSVYFVHSYIMEPESKEHILATSSYGGYEFCAAVRKGNIYGVQFHPEKSGEAGLQIIKQFVESIQ